MPWIQINSATPKLVSEIAKGRREQSRAQQPRDPQPETLAVPGQGQNSQPRGKEWLKPFYQDQGRSGSYSVLGSFRGVSPNYRYHGRVCMVQVTTFVPGARFTPSIFCPSAPSRPESNTCGVTYSHLPLM